jgi:UDP-glucose-4-epimerase GalE
MTTVLVTGASGYLGSHLCKKLKQEGIKVVGYDSKPPKHGHMDIFYEGDIRRKSSLLDLFSRVKIDSVFHLAARIEVGLSWEYPNEFMDVNTGGTCNLLNVMSMFRVKNIIYSSTAGVYAPSNVPIKENGKTAENHPYGISKQLAETAIRYSNINHVIFRYFNLGGADLDGEMGECHDPETHLIPNILQNLNSVEIYGDNYETPDGTCVRDYVHVCDVADAHFDAFNYLNEGKKSITLNLGTGQGVSVLEMVNLVSEITGEYVDYDILPRRQGDPPVLVADISLAEKVLHYRPKHDIMSIITTASEWHKNESI